MHKLDCHALKYKLEGVDGQLPHCPEGLCAARAFGQSECDVSLDWHRQKLYEALKSAKEFGEFGFVYADAIIDAISHKDVYELVDKYLDALWSQYYRPLARLAADFAHWIDESDRRLCEGGNANGLLTFSRAQNPHDPKTCDECNRLAGVNNGAS